MMILMRESFDFTLDRHYVMKSFIGHMNRLNYRLQMRYIKKRRLIN